MSLFGPLSLTLEAVASKGIVVFEVVDGLRGVHGRRVEPIVVRHCFGLNPTAWPTDGARGCHQKQETNDSDREKWTAPNDTIKTANKRQQQREKGLAVGKTTIPGIRTFVVKHARKGGLGAILC